MKKYILIFALLLLCKDNLFSQSTTPGYYITLQGDTVTARVKLQKSLSGQIMNNFFEKVEIIDTAKNNSQTFMPENIKGYGFSYNGVRYLFVAKPIKNGSKKFLTPVVVGTKSSLYQYSATVSGSGYALASASVYYTFEKFDGNYLFLKNILNKKFKTQLLAFYSEDSNVQQLINFRLQYWLEMQKDLVEIVKAYNR